MTAGHGSGSGQQLELVETLRRDAAERHPDKDSLRGKMMSCMLNTDYLTQVLYYKHV